MRIDLDKNDYNCTFIVACSVDMWTEVEEKQEKQEEKQEKKKKSTINIYKTLKITNLALMLVIILRFMMTCSERSSFDECTF